MAPKRIFYLFKIFLVYFSLNFGSVNVGATDANEGDAEAAVKCDACMLIATKFSKSFSAAEERIRSVRLSDQQSMEATESVCDSQWVNYSTVMVDGAMRLAGPDTGREASVLDGGDNVWSHRLQDLCDELLAEVTSERMLYEAWASGGEDALEHTLCRGVGTFSACSSDNFGPWPGDDDYDDYDENDDFDYVHDEF
ncbi:uncharacterized protein LOC108681017 [Hyalella azteca]|uniref:Uncharacterized protein LOC108681017 n=1 Tax=Hyalella azteca TaxID=294128 RepID=A0A8B7PH15_HYAAZ|nr:uncharacterized protein LOC108681017 [Hyalella azteca]